MTRTTDEATALAHRPAKRAPRGPGCRSHHARHRGTRGSSPRAAKPSDDQRASSRQASCEKAPEADAGARRSVRPAIAVTSSALSLHARTQTAPARACFARNRASNGAYVENARRSPACLPQPKGLLTSSGSRTVRSATSANSASFEGWQHDRCLLSRTSIVHMVTATCDQVGLAECNEPLVAFDKRRVAVVASARQPRALLSLVRPVGAFDPSDANRLAAGSPTARCSRRWRTHQNEFARVPHLPRGSLSVATASPIVTSLRRVSSRLDAAMRPRHSVFGYRQALSLAFGRCSQSGRSSLHLYHDPLRVWNGVMPRPLGFRHDGESRTHDFIEFGR